MKHQAFVFFIFFFTSFLFGQISEKDKQAKIIASFVDSYNQQQYTRMKKTFFLIGRILPIKSKLRMEFEPRYNKYGKASIGNIEHVTDKKSIVELNYEKNSSEKEYVIFYFNKKNKIEGLNFKRPDFKYKINNNQKVNLNKQAKIDSLVLLKHTNGFNGSVLVIDQGKELYAHSVGYTNFDTKEVLNENSVFELASCSKQFTGMAIMLLVEQGKINYADNIKTYIPNLPYENITVEHLLTHTSGLPDYMELVEKHWNKKKFVTNNDMVELFKQYKPKTYYQPGETFDYSNTGYALLSVIIEKISGMTYAEFLDKNIFKPLGMKNTLVYNTRRSKGEKVSDYAYGYIYSDKFKKYVLPDSVNDFKYVIYMDAITGDGTVNSCVKDLAIWDKALREHQLVKASTFEKALTPFKLKNGKVSEYSSGQFIVNDQEYESLIYHGGSWPGYSTFILHFMNRETTIVVLSNNEYDGTDKLADEIATILLNAK